VDDQGYLVREMTVEKPPAVSVPNAGEVWALVEAYKNFGQFPARMRVQEALRARDAETANLKALLARWEAAVGCSLQQVEEIERQQVAGEAGRAAGGTATTPAPAGG
jgi:hypothetical protein